MFHLLQITALLVGLLAFRTNRKCTVASRFPVSETGSDWVTCGFPALLYITTAHICFHSAFSPSFSLCLHDNLHGPSVILSIVYLKHLWVDWIYLYFGHWWWNEHKRLWCKKESIQTTFKNLKDTSNYNTEWFRIYLRSNCLWKKSRRVPIPPNCMNWICKKNHSDYTGMISEDNMRLSVWQKTGLVTVCYLVFPGAPYTCRWEKLWDISMAREVQDCKEYVLWVVFKTSIKEFCPRVPKDVIY